MNKREAERLIRQQAVLMSLGFTMDEAEKLRRISMTLRRWHEMECGINDGCIERDGDNSDDVPYWRNSITGRRYRIADRETGAKKRLAAIIERRNSFGDVTEHENGGCTITKREPVTAYIQGDPRGAALYIIRPADVPEGQSADGFYNRGICVY